MIQAHTKLVRFLATVAIVSQAFLPVGSALAQSLDRFYENSEGSPHVTLISGAEKTLELEVYTLKSTKIMNALKKAMERGVKLSIVQDPDPVDACKVFYPVGPSDDAKCLEMKGFLKHVRKNGGVYVPFNKNLCAPGGVCFQHGKIVVADSKLVMLSTGNFNPSNLCDKSENPAVCNRDYTVVSRDPVVVRAIQAIVKADTENQVSDIPAIVNSTAGRISVSPFSLDPLVRFIDSAKKTVQLENQYLKNPEMNAAIVRAARRGVKVFIMVASACAFGRPDENAIASWTRIYSEFDAAGVNTKTFNASIPVNGRPGYLHTKAILVDSKRAWVGSVNGSNASLTRNREFGIFTEEPEFVKKLAQHMYQNFTERNAQTWKQSLRCEKDYNVPAPKPDEEERP
jgi:phosphatidylserine/phosphatidylglycerophosphate/cardiolipin synthase-like enzyme